MDNSAEKLRRDWEVWKATEHRNIEVWKTEMLQWVATYQTVNLQGQGALKAALFINGGASVALLAFIGTAMNKDVNSSLVLTLCSSMITFVSGTLVAAIASGVTYLAGFIDGYIKDEERGSKWKFWRHWNFYNTTAIALVIISFVLFLWASLKVYCAFKVNLLGVTPANSVLGYLYSLL
jgi:hypothetical protein